jgi:hypothetical protein
MLYLLDSNVLITANDTYYELERIRPFWDWICAEAKRNVVKIPQEMWDEITPASEDFLLWLSANQVDLAIDEVQSPSLVESVLLNGYGFNQSDLDDIATIEQTNDAILIAYALADRSNRCVVTLEGVQSPDAHLPKPENRKIPLVCHRLGVTCINTFDLIRQLDFRIP